LTLLACSFSVLRFDIHGQRANNKGPFGRVFPSASPLASTEALPNP
jgi:hypothetical protein